MWLPDVSIRELVNFLPDASGAPFYERYGYCGSRAVLSLLVNVRGEQLVAVQQHSSILATKHYYMLDMYFATATEQNYIGLFCIMK